jgi:hypothetical protein
LAEKKIKIQLPAGIAVWPKLDKPDVYYVTDKKGKPVIDKETGQQQVKTRYITEVKYDDATLEKIIETFNKIAAKHLPDCENPKLPIKVVKKGDRKGERTVIMTSGAKFKPPVFDAQNEKVPASVIIGGGSLIKPAVTVNPYDGFGGGLNLYMDAIQLLKLEQNERTSPFEKAEGFTYTGGEDANADEEVRDHNADADDGEETYTF